MPAVRLEKASFRYDRTWVLRDVSLDVEHGAFLGILGPNGSGKTTLLNLIDGILAPREGRVLLEGADAASLDRNELARIVAVVPQDSPLIFPFTVQEIVLMGRAPHLGRWRFEGKQDFEIARNAMERTGTLPLAGRPMSALSGGERQRVFIARALAQEPRILLLDEPTSNLDIRHQSAFFGLVAELNRTQGLTVIAVSHDINLASLYCRRIVLLKDGTVHGEGRPEEIISEESIRNVFGVPVRVDRHPQTGKPRITPICNMPPERGSRSNAGAAPQL
ncbi:MAG: ABC transporter ATP-binding protein [Syntrophales bacterium]